MKTARKSALSGHALQNCYNSMNKKAKTNLLMNNLSYLILLIIFFLGMLAFVYLQSNGAAVWEDYYAKEIVKVVDLSTPGDTIVLDVHKGTGIAKSNQIGYEEIFQFDNLNHEVCVKLSKGRASCFSYVNNVTVTFDDTGKWISFAEPVNRLHFKIIGRGEKNG